jgi:dTDP-4-dehydrorhamnose 3,5-epimerase
MDPMTLETIRVTPLKRIENISGDILHAMKKNDFGYSDFGEAYFSWIFSAKIKAWKKHSKMTMNLIVPIGQVRFVFCKIKNNNKSEFIVEEIGEDRYVRLTVPPGIWFGFQGISKSPSLILNIANIPHDETEVERLDLLNIKYDWA